MQLVLLVLGQYTNTLVARLKNFKLVAIYIVDNDSKKVNTLMGYNQWYRHSNNHRNYRCIYSLHNLMSRHIVATHYSKIEFNIRLTQVSFLRWDRQIIIFLSTFALRIIQSTSCSMSNVNITYTLPYGNVNIMCQCKHNLCVAVYQS